MKNLLYLMLFTLMSCYPKARGLDCDYISNLPDIIPMEHFQVDEERRCYIPGKQYELGITAPMPDADSYLWSNGSTDSMLVTGEIGRYELEVFDTAGTEIHSDVFVISDDHCQIHFNANTFTPNGDGINDEWVPLYAVDICPSNFICHIRNSDGILLWESAHLSSTWNGTYKNQMVESGVYYYEISAEFIDGNKLITGQIHVLK